MGSSASATLVVDANNPFCVQPWMRASAVPQTRIDQDKFAPMSKGFQRVNNNVIIKTSKNEDITIGAKWSKGFTHGKHIFEIGFPVALRGKHCSVGIATASAPLQLPEVCALVGATSDSWGIDLTSSQARHNGQSEGKYPKKSRLSLPDRFYMYVDLDNKTLYFGSDSRFYGPAFTEIDPQGSPVYPMVSANKCGATISVFYRGKGKVISGPLRKKR